MYGMTQAMAGGSSPIILATCYQSTAVAISNDGINWRLGTSIPTANAGGCIPLVYCNSLQLFVAVVDTAEANNILTTPDGITWTQHSAATANEAWRGLGWSEALGLCVGNASTGTTNYAFSSSNLSTFTNRNNSNPNYNTSTSSQSCSYSPSLGMFVNSSASGPNDGMYSTNGTSWTTVSTSQTGGVSCWSPNLGIFVSANVGGTTQSYSTAGSSGWTGATTNFPGSAGGAICWSPERGRFQMAVQSNNQAHSTDGKNWNYSAITAGSPGYWNHICWSGNLSLFIMVSNNAIATSPDGQTWTARTTPATHNYAVVASNDCFHGNGRC